MLTHNLGLITYHHLFMHRDPPRQRIVLRYFFHRNNRQVGLHFPYQVKIKEHILQLPGVRWTQTHRCFYMGDHPDQINALLNHCRGKIWVDMTQLQKRDDPKSKAAGKKVISKKVSSSNPVKIAKATFKKIEAMQRWMEQKRYSPHTVKTYIALRLLWDVRMPW